MTLDLRLLEMTQSQQGSPLWLAQLLFSLSRRHNWPFSVLAFCEAEDRKQDDIAAQVEPIGRRPRRLLSVVATEAIRDTDVLLPLGGPGNFVVLCPGTDAEGAIEVVRRLQMNPDGRVLHVGQATFIDDEVELEDLVQSALARMNQAKAEGTTFGSKTMGSLHDYRVREDEGRPRDSRRVDAQIRLKRQQRRDAVKRAFDIVAVVLASPIWLPVLAIVAACIKYGDPSAPVFFVQHRTGLAARNFGMLKLRTMVPNAEELKEELRHLSIRAWPDFKIIDDPRITPIGKVLRRTSLDEVPQLLNVLMGDMSLVGPRPTSFSPSTYEPWQTARLSVRPGMTGLWQVEGRGRVDFDERLRLDLMYIEKRSFWYDLWILLRTIPAVLEQRGGE